MSKSAADDIKLCKSGREGRQVTNGAGGGAGLVAHALCIGSGGKPQDLTVKCINICDLIKSIPHERLNCG